MLLTVLCKVNRMFNHRGSYNGKGVARGGPGVPVTPPPPFVSRFLLKQPTIFRLQKREYPLVDRV